MKRILEFIKNLFTIKCPVCKSEMKLEFDMEFDFMYYECSKCERICK